MLRGKQLDEVIEQVQMIVGLVEGFEKSPISS